MEELGSNTGTWLGSELALQVAPPRTSMKQAGKQQTDHSGCHRQPGPESCWDGAQEGSKQEELGSDVVGPILPPSHGPHLVVSPGPRNSQGFQRAGRRQLQGPGSGSGTQRPGF